MELRIPVVNATEALEWCIENVDMTERWNFFCGISYVGKNYMQNVDIEQLLKYLQDPIYWKSPKILNGVYDDRIIISIDDKDKAMLCKLKFG